MTSGQRNERGNEVTYGTKFMVYGEHTLVYQQQGMTDLQIIHASILRGSPFPACGMIPMPADTSKLRPATLDDFKAFRSLPPSAEELAESTALQAA